MPDLSKPDETRRSLLRAIAWTPIALATPRLLGPAGCSASADATTEPTEPSADPTLACVDDDDAEATLAETEGPYFTPNSPERTSLLESGLEGTLLTLSGLVLTRSCRPVEGSSSTSGRPTTEATTTTTVTGCADTSSPTRAAASGWRPSCQVSTRDAPDTST